MRAVWTLALLPLRQAWVAALLLLLMLAGAIALALAGGKALYGGAMLAASALWFAWLLAGVTLKGLARKETMLLPDFHRALAGAAALWALLFWLLPCALTSLHWGLPVGWLALAVGALAIAWAVLTTSGSRSGFLIWVLIIGARFIPQPFWLSIEPALHNPLLPLAALLLAALMLRMTWQRLFPIGDPPLPDSPLLASEPMRRGNNTTSNVPRGKLMQRLNGWSEHGASALLQREAARYHATSTPGRQRAMLRALLLPHEQPRGWLVRWLLWGAFVAVYALALGHSAQIGMIAGYATFFAMSGLNVVGTGMPRLQPSLVELYFTLAPDTRAAFKAQLVDSFLGVLPGAILSAFVFTGLAALLIAPHALVSILATTAILAPPLALATLALYLSLPFNVILRSVVTGITIFGQMGTIWLGYALLERFGPLWGGAPVLVITWSFAIGAWSAARKHWIDSPLSFDPPRAKAGA
ncbi:hypothetical protein [Metallibacterium sp.]|uniref:hypothetical protein n=1 Tax=Metallibacterium sp. TaxID=2940281 RepID=UPI00260BE088|nr:hypothetical protein [Metallibacterium sp.]